MMGKEVKVDIILENMLKSAGIACDFFHNLFNHKEKKCAIEIFFITNYKITLREVLNNFNGY